MKSNHKSFRFVLLSHIVFFTGLVIALVFLLNLLLDNMSSSLIGNMVQFEESITYAEATSMSQSAEELIQAVQGERKVLDPSFRVVFPEEDTMYTQEEMIQLMNGTYQKKGTNYKAVLTPISDRKGYFQVFIAPSSKVQTNYLLEVDLMESGYVRLLNLFLVSFVVAIIGYFVLMKLLVDKMNRKIITPIADFREDMKAVAKGNYTLDPTSYEIAEFDEMRKAFENMTQKLNELSKKAANDEYLRSQLISELGHDIKNSITPVMGYAILLKEQNQLGEREKEYIECILSNCEDMERMLYMLVYYGKLSRVDYHLNQSPVDITELFRTCIGEAYASFEEKNMRQKINLPHKEIILSIDPLEMKRSISNIIQNAASHNSCGSMVQFHIWENPYVVDLIIADNGKTIPLGESGAIFEPFIREKPTKDKKGHFGLGLSIAQKVVTKHGGELKLVQPYKKMTKAFIIRLPKEDYL